MIERQRHNLGYPMCCAQHAYIDETGIPVCMICGNMNPSPTTKTTYIPLSDVDKQANMYCC